MFVTDRLVDFICAPTVAPPDVAKAVELCLLDWASVTIAGKNEPVSRLVREKSAQEGGREEAHVCGLDQRLPARSAALVNGVTSHALDYDDTHFASLGHPSVAVFPAVVALADRAGASMGDVKASALIGAEIAIRMGVWLGRDHYRTGFHVTGTAGAFGAAAGAAHLLHLTEDQTRMALGMTASLAGGVKVQFGTMAKPMHAGLAAATGVDAALWAKSGLIATDQGLEGPQGFAATHHGANDNKAFDGLGQRYLYPEVSHKFHACCHGTHAMLEALLALREAYALCPDDVTSIEVIVHPQYLNICNISDPVTGLEAKFSYRQLAAMVLCGVPTDRLDSFTDAICTNPDIANLRSRVVVRADPFLSETNTRVEVKTTAGEHLNTDYDLADPMSEPMRKTRLRDKSAALVGQDRCMKLVAATRRASANNAASPGAELLVVEACD